MSMFVAFWCLASLSVTSDTIRISRILRWLLVRTEAKSTGNDGTFGTSTGPATRLTLQPIIRDPYTQHRMTDSFFLCGLGSFDSVARKIHVSFSRTCINTFALPFRIAFDQTQKFEKKKSVGAMDFRILFYNSRMEHQKVFKKRTCQRISSSGKYIYVYK